MNFIRDLRSTAPIIGLVVAFSGGTAHAIQRVERWSVSTTVTQVGATSWNYEFTVGNDSLLPNFASQFALPYFSDAGITNLHSPTGWTTSYVDTVGGTPLSNWYLMNAAPQALLWATSNQLDMVPVGSSLSGFGFTSPYSPVKGPSIVLFSNGSGGVMDPGIPGSPSAIAAGFTASFPVTPVPETTSLAMMLVGLTVVGGVLRRRQTSH